MIDKNIVQELKVSKTIEYLENIAESFQNLPCENIENFRKDETVIIHVDIINGFLRDGALSSSIVNEITDYIVELNKRTENYSKIFFVDTHEENAKEFKAFPGHCIKGTEESEIIPELIPFIKETDIVFPKNSTNGFVAPNFTDWLENNRNIRNFIIVGDVTDICVMQFALTLNAYFNQWNMQAKIVIPIKGVDTFELEATNHGALMMNLFALYNMKMNGVEIVKDIL